MAIKIENLSIKSSEKYSELLILKGNYTIRVGAYPAETLPFYAEYDTVEEIMEELDIFLPESKIDSLESVSEIIEFFIEEILLNSDMSSGEYIINTKIANFYVAFDKHMKIFKKGFDKSIDMFKRKVQKEFGNSDELIIRSVDVNNFSLDQY